MNKYRLEQVSSLVDDKQDDPSIIDVLGCDEELRRTWGRYHLISNCLKGHLPKRVDCALADRIKASMADEPAIIIPGSKYNRVIQKMIKPVTSFAMAASIAAMAVYVWQQGGHSGVVDSDSIAPVSNIVNGTNEQVTAIASQVERKTRNFQYEDEAQLRLDRYLVNYNEYRTDSGIGGIFPYARIVAYDPKK